MANDNSEIHAPDAKVTKSVSAHRAFVYAAGLPGWGEMYARAWWQGALTLTVFLGFLAWFCWLGWQSAQMLASWQDGPLRFPLRELGLAFLGMLACWFWGIFNAARLAQSAREYQNLPRQTSPAWAAAMSWLCPGSGLGYGGRALFGGLFLLLYACGMGLMAPAYAEFGKSVGFLLSPENYALIHNPIAVAQAVHKMFFMLENSLPSVFLATTKMLAIALAVDLVAKKREEQAVFSFETDEKPKWFQGKEVRAMGLFALGWFAPGGGQLLLGRSYGWYFLAGVTGCQLAVSVLLRHKLLTMDQAGLVLWIPAVLRFAAMLEAPVRLLGRRPAPAPREEAG